jgi:hypothetical protein
MLSPPLRTLVSAPAVVAATRTVTPTNAALPAMLLYMLLAFR